MWENNGGILDVSVERGVLDLQHAWPKTSEQCCMIDWFWFQKLELIPGVKIYDKEDISTMKGWTTNRESKNKNDLHGERQWEDSTGWRETDLQST